MLCRANARDEALFPKKIWQDIVTEVDSHAVQEEQTRAASNWRLEPSLFDLVRAPLAEYIPHNRFSVICDSRIKPRKKSKKQFKK